jgi:hypothetical protein
MLRYVGLIMFMASRRRIYPCFVLASRVWHTSSGAGSCFPLAGIFCRPHLPCLLYSDTLRLWVLSLINKSSNDKKYKSKQIIPNITLVYFSFIYATWWFSVFSNIRVLLFDLTCTNTWFLPGATWPLNRPVIFCKHLLVLPCLLGHKQGTPDVVWICKAYRVDPVGQ